MTDEEIASLVIPALIFLLFIFLTGNALGKKHGRWLAQNEASERGLGLYCPVDGEFAWVGECPTKEGQ